MTLDHAVMDSPLGPIALLAQGDALIGLEFVDKPDRVGALRRGLAHRLGSFGERPTRDPAGAVTRLTAYFAGDLRALDAQPMSLHGTPFQVAAWEALRSIPAGATLSYAGLAARLGRPTAMRAVGAANGRNSVALFVPCHRVIAADGTLGGYGGGLDRKQWLLAHEGALEGARPGLPYEDPVAVGMPLASRRAT